VPSTTQPLFHIFALLKWKSLARTVASWSLASLAVRSKAVCSLPISATLPLLWHYIIFCLFNQKWYYNFR
jgi:hypothetical protein